ncbi:hypothetical protein NQ314_008228 [Rhamnusium bicolor]|uniref:Uncharacterized protein n=1 Tax=Rhamnusium bicolor TaxID=1586634 RepID=A0AAV8YEX0_9CUCU|nr:hypothetical protein NQ314_008228 [Rhamnusium bicolor]
MASIYKYNLKTYFNTNSIRHFIDDGNNTVHGVPVNLVLKRWKNCRTKELCIEEVATSKDTVYCGPKYHIDYLLRIHKDKRQYIHCLRERILTIPILMIIRKGFPLSSLFDKIIHRITEAGFIFKWENDIIKYISADNKNDPEDFDKNSIKFKHLVHTFLMLLIGNAISFILFVGEIVFYKRNNTSLEKEIFFFATRNAARRKLSKFLKII